MSSDNQDSLYIPPQGLAFRLLGYASQKVIYCRTHLLPEVGLHSVAEDFSDQYFTLLYGTGEKAGSYAIKSRVTGNVLFSRIGADPRVGQISGDGAYSDNWFKLEPGEGKYLNFFRLITSSQNQTLALVSRTHQEPYFFNHPANEVASDQYFCFLFEDVQFDRIDYDLDKGRIFASKPLVITGEYLTNKTDRDQQMSCTVSYSVVNTSTHEFRSGFTITIGTKFTAGIPIVSQGEFSFNASTTQEWKWGESTSTTQTISATLPVTAGPGQTVRAVSMVQRGTLDVPFTAHLRGKTTGVEVETKGIWYGVSAWDVHHMVETVEQSNPT